MKLLFSTLFALLTVLSSAPTAFAAAPRIDAEKVLPSKGWRVRPDTRYSASWFASRYGIAAPGFAEQDFEAPNARIDICYLRPAGKGDDARLWEGLRTDLLPNQALARSGDEIVWIVSANSQSQEDGLQLLATQPRATPVSDDRWRAVEIPSTIAGLTPSYSGFIHELPQLEKQVDGFPLRGMYQSSFQTEGERLVRGAAVVSMWIPRDSKRLQELLRILRQKQTSEQTIFSGKGTAVVLLARNSSGEKILAELLTAKGYRLESPPRPAPTPALTPAVPIPPATTPGH